MKIIILLAHQPKRIWRFLGFYQKPALRLVHALIVLLVIMQLGSSYFMRFTQGFPLISAWYHIVAGIGLCALTVSITVIGLKSHGLRHFFPYLWGENEQIIKDIKATLRFKIIAPRPKGMAAAVQGLGLGALWLTAFSGLLWFILWRSGNTGAAYYARTFHNWASLLVIIYFIGHGGMAFMHFIHWQKSAKNLDGNESKTKISRQGHPQTH